MNLLQNPPFASTLRRKGIRMQNPHFRYEFISYLRMRLEQALRNGENTLHGGNQALDELLEELGSVLSEVHRSPRGEEILLWACYAASADVIQSILERWSSSR